MGPSLIEKDRRRVGKASRKKRERQRGQVDVPKSVGFALDTVRQFLNASQHDLVRKHLCGAIEAQLYVWCSEPVIIRFDDTLVAALSTTDPTTPLERSWAARSRFGSLFGILDNPIDLHDGTEVVRYLGFLVTGHRIDEEPNLPEIDLPTRSGRRLDTSPTFSWYPPLHAPDITGVRFVWILRHEDGSPGAQTMTPQFHEQPASIGDVIQALVDITEQTSNTGPEIEPLASIGLQALAWLSASEPDLQQLRTPPHARRLRPLSSRNADQSDPIVYDGGFRIGAELRSTGILERPVPEETGPGGWRLPPHVRAAHFHRVRVATRDGNDTIIGDTQGVEDVDWHYELRWYPPTLVNATDSGDVPTTIRSAQS